MRGAEDIPATVHIHHNYFFRPNCFLLWGLSKPVTDDHLRFDIGLVSKGADISNHQMGGSRRNENEIMMVLDTVEWNLRVVLVLPTIHPDGTACIKLPTVKTNLSEHRGSEPA